MAYVPFEFNEQTCLEWKAVIDQECVGHCGNCTGIGEKLRAQCMFKLQVLGDGQKIIEYCADTVYNFVHYRCPSACMEAFDGYEEFLYETCQTPEAVACKRMCGNFQDCGCRRLANTAFAGGIPGAERFVDTESCEGETVLPGFQCDWQPFECRANHPLGVPCNLYRWCPTDMCLVNNVTCHKPTQCMSGGLCEPKQGLCYPAQEPLGYPCDDGFAYTLGDHCSGGACMGRTDYCLKYNVSCSSYDPCLTGGVCNPGTGRCSYDQVIDDTLCDDGRPYTLEDRCRQGLCKGRAVNLCQSQGVVCRAPSECYDPGVCDPETGQCSAASAAHQPRDCNDGDPTTRNDTCVNGLCLGEIVDTAGQPIYDKFLSLGRGECTDREGLQMNSYAGDVLDVLACEAQCLKDFQCAAYSYMYPSCRIYGAVRTRVPYEEDPDRVWVFRPGTVPLGVAVERATMRIEGQRVSFCRRRGDKADSQEDYTEEDYDINFFFGAPVLSVFFVLLTCCYFCAPFIRRRCVTCCKSCRERCQRAEDESDDEPPDSPPSKIQDTPDKTPEKIADGVPTSPASGAHTSSLPVGQYAPGCEPAPRPPDTNAALEDGSESPRAGVSNIAAADPNKLNSKGAGKGKKGADQPAIAGSSEGTAVGAAGGIANFLIG